MGGMSSHVFWSQPWDSDSENYLYTSLTSIGCSIRELSSQQWNPETAFIGEIRDYMAAYVAPASNKWSSVMLHLNASVAERLAVDLSKSVVYAIAFFEYEQAAWGYVAYKNGMVLDRFWNVPDIVEMNKEECKGNVDSISNIFGVSSELVAPYLRHIDLDNDFNSKAFEDDEYTLDNHWVRCDFMRRLGINYPIPGETESGRYIHIIE